MFKSPGGHQYISMGEYILIRTCKASRDAPASLHRGDRDAGACRALWNPRAADVCSPALGGALFRDFVNVDNSVGSLQTAYRWRYHIANVAGRRMDAEGSDRGRGCRKHLDRAADCKLIQIYRRSPEHVVWLCILGVNSDKASPTTSNKCKSCLSHFLA